MGVRAVPAAVLSHHLALPVRCPGCPTAHPLDVGAEISLHGRALAVQPLLEGIPGVPLTSSPSLLFLLSPSSPTAAKDEVLLLGRRLGACTRA